MNILLNFQKKNVSAFLASRPPDAKPINLDHVHFIKRNCFLPAPEETKYDRIHVGCCCPESHILILYDMLNPNGILVTPFGDKLVKSTKMENGDIKTETLVSVRYSDLTLPSDAEIKEAQKQIAIAKANQITVPQTSIHTQFANLVNNKHFSDFMFVVEGKKLHVHKLLLQLRSEYFRDMFSSGVVNGEIEIKDCSYDVFVEFLKYLYQDHCETSCQLLQLGKKYHVDGLVLKVRTEYFRRMFSSGLRESQSNRIEIFDCTTNVFIDVLRFIYTDTCAINDDNCIPLLEQANFFQLDRLKAICECYWFDNINVHNAASVLQVADRFNALQLKNFAMEFIFSHIQDVVKTDAWRDLDPSLVSHILIASVQRSK